MSHCHHKRQRDELFLKQSVLSMIVTLVYNSA